MSNKIKKFKSIKILPATNGVTVDIELPFASARRYVFNSSDNMAHFLRKFLIAEEEDKK